ncbi:hypothetical protein Tco_1340872 [Tanacetum coccineum]
MPGRPPINRKKDKYETKNQNHVGRPPRSMTCKNYGETGHNKNGCEKPKIGGTNATGSNRGRGNASGSNRGRGSVSGSNRGRENASGSNRGRRRASGSTKVLVKKPVVSDKYILLDEDDLVDVQVKEEVDTRDENIATADAYENVAAEADEQDENQDEASRGYKAWYKKPRRTR